MDGDYARYTVPPGGSNRSVPRCPTNTAVVPFVCGQSIQVEVSRTSSTLVRRPGGVVDHHAQTTTASRWLRRLRLDDPNRRVGAVHAGSAFGIVEPDS